MMGDAMHATMPMDFWLEGLDNGARLDWDMPNTVALGAEVVGYRIYRDAWNSYADHPINTYGDATIDEYDASMTDYTDLGLAYETVYTYRVKAIVQYDVEHWWNNLNCPMMNKVVNPENNEPQVGSDDPMASPMSPYCRMYDGLSDAAKVVVHRAYDGLEGMYPDQNSYGRYALGAWTMMRAIETADSGGRLEPLLDPPSEVRDLRLNPACADSIGVSWQEPADFGTVPTVDENGVYVGPDYIGGDRAGKEEVGEDAGSVTYQVQRMVDSGSWVTVTHTGMVYTDSDVEYGKTYKYRVRARNGATLYGPWQMIQETLTEPAGVTRPQNLRATLNDEGNVVLQWTAPEGGNQDWRERDDDDLDVGNGDESKRLTYHIEREGSVDPIRVQQHRYGPRSFKTQTNPTKVTHEQTYTDVDVDDTAKSATYVIYAIVDECLLSEGNSVTLNIETTAPGMPTGLSANVRGNSVMLSWTAPSEPGARGDVRARVTGYQIERHSGDGNFASIASDHGATTYTDTSLTYGTTYTYRVSATNSFAKTGVPSAIATATPQQLALGAITDLALSNSLELTWTPAVSATSQIAIVVNVADDTDFCLAPSLAASASSYACTGASATAGTAYVGLVIALDGSGGSSVSNFPVRVVQ